MKQYTVVTGSSLFGLCLVVTAVLFVLKVAGVIAASWWLVLAPLLVWLGLVAAGFALVLIGIIVTLLFAVVVWLFEGRP